MYDPKRGFGFIVPDGGDADLFFHVRDVGDDAEPQVGRRVAFDAGVNPRNGRPRATGVRLV
jgi:cold shock CspA family protein